MKSKIVIEVKHTNCKCDSPDLIDTISVGVKGYFTFCKRCKLERRLSQNDIDQMIRERQ